MKNKMKKMTIFLGIIMAVSSIGMAKSNKNIPKRPTKQNVCRNRNGKIVKCNITSKNNTNNNRQRFEPKPKQEVRRNEPRKEEVKRDDNIKNDSRRPNTTISTKRPERATSSR